MNTAMLNRVLGQEDASVLQNQIECLHSISSEICTALESSEDAIRVLLYESFAPARIKVIGSVIENIKIKLDIRFKHEAKAQEVYTVRNYLIGLFSALREIEYSITKCNDHGLRSYNNDLIDLLSRQCR